MIQAKNAYCFVVEIKLLGVEIIQLKTAILLKNVSNN